MLQAQKTLIDDFQRLSPDQRREIIQQLAELTPNGANSSDTYIAAPFTLVMNMISGWTPCSPDTSLGDAALIMENYISNWISSQQ